MTRVIADLHLHSRYSRATSQKMNIDEINRFAKIKGVNLVGVGDFSHPKWLKELNNDLVTTSETGLYKSAKDKDSSVRFMITNEVSTIFPFEGKTKRIHHVLLTPGLETATQVNDRLARHGDLANDGRPALNVSASQLVEEVMEVSSENVVIPSHVWTPWFSLFGAFSGFDRVKDCYQDMTKHIYALETGLSSDPPMNWRLSALDQYTLISNSDSHCVHPDTRVHLVKGRVSPIKDLDNGTDVLAVDFRNGLKLRHRKCIRVHKRVSPSALFHIKTRTRAIQVTPMHRFFILENGRIIEKYASELKKNELVACLRKNLRKRGNIDPSISESLRENDVIWEPTVKIEETSFSNDYVYDLTVPGYENYVANGIIVHNSAWPWRIGREANVFEVKRLTYHEMVNAIRKKDRERFKFTIETNPAYGKYHWTGHRNCNVSLPPQEAVKLGNICPVCRRNLTKGVEQRVEELADRSAGFKPDGALEYMHLLPLSEIIATVFGVNYPGARKVWNAYNALVARFGDEYTVLIDAPKKDLLRTVDPKIAEVIIQVRKEQVRVIPGYDGVYGRLSLSKGNKSFLKKGKQRSIADFLS